MLKCVAEKKSLIGKKQCLWNEFGVWRVMLLFFTRLFPNIETFRSMRYRYSLIENSTSILTEGKEASQPKWFLTYNNLNIYYLMVVLRFLFRSFTPTFSLYKAVLIKGKKNANKTWKLHSTGTGKQAQSFPEKQSQSLREGESTTENAAE